MQEPSLKGFATPCGLHRSIPDHELPRCLRRPLVFGDRQQIDALYDLEARIEEEEDERRAMESGGLKQYRVHLSWEAEETVTVQEVKS